jgi:inhibitor of cysteine peptidase
MTGKKLFIVTVIIAMVVIIGACQPISNNGDKPVSSDDPVVNPTLINFSAYQEQAHIDQIQILLLESFPLQVNVVVVGNLPDGCTSIVGTRAIKTEENVFEIHVYTERMIDALCTMALVPFEENIKLDVYGLDAGTYLVKANDLSESFTFEMDNK